LTVTHVIAAVNLRGGLGKTTSAVAISEVLAGEHQRRVLVIDLDGLTNATTMLIHELRWRELNEKGYTVATLFEDALGSPAEGLFDLDSTLQHNVSNVRNLRGLDLLPSSLDLFRVQDRLGAVSSEQAEFGASSEIVEGALRTLLEGYEYVVVDCPANLGIITLNGLRIADGYIIPTGADVLSAYAIRLIVKRVEQFSMAIGREIVPLGTLVTNYRPPTTLAPVSIKSLREDPDVPPVFNTVIPAGELPGSPAEFTPKSTLREKYGGGDQGYFEYYRSLTLEVMHAVNSAKTQT
jgi:chromosome partitioning protein